MIDISQAKFLAAYAACGNISTAASLAQLGRDQHYRWLKNDEGYKAKFADAHEQACESLEEEARRRAVSGVEEPVFGSGGQGVGTVQVGVVRKYSDTLLIFLMKGVMPEKYRERQSIEHSGGTTTELRIVTDPNWYGNDAHTDAAASIAAPDSRAAIGQPHEAVGLRTAMGKDLGGTASGDEGARTDARPLSGSD